MVHIKKLFSLSLIFSLIVASPLLAMEEMSFSEFDMSSNIDLDEATLEFSPESVRTDGLEENIGLFYDKEGFFVRADDEDVRVQTYDTDKLFRGRNIKDVARYATQGKFKVSKFNNGEYVIAAHGDLKGGGPVLAAIAAVGVRVIGYGISAPFILVPGGQAIFLAGCQITEVAATVATGAAMAAPTF